MKSIVQFEKSNVYNYLFYCFIQNKDNHFLSVFHQMQNNKKNDQVDTKNDRRDSSSSNKQSPTNKFLKRKPDGKKVILGVGSKNKKQAIISDYFHEEILSDRQFEVDNLSDHKPQNDKYIQSSNQLKFSLKTINDNSIKMLQTARSENNLFIRKKQSEVPMVKYRENDKNIKNLCQNEHSQGSKKQDLQKNECNKQNNTSFQLKITSKKSRTQYFTHDQIQNIDSNNQTGGTDDIYQMSSSRLNADTSKNYQNMKSQCETFSKKNKWMQQQIELLRERQYLLQTEHTHLDKIILQKDKIIDRLTRQKNLLANRYKNENDIDIIKLKETISAIKHQLQKQQQRNVYLKQENTFLQNELLSKNEELVMVYQKYTQLEYVYKKQQKKMRQTLQNMKIQAQRVKNQAKQQILQIDSYGQIQKWRQKLTQQHQQLKYLKIQNQCLLISKDQLLKSQNENRKLRDQRDYFKKKVLEHIKRSKTNASQISQQSSGGSILFELSEISIDQ